MSVPRKAVTEEPSTEPLSPRGTLLSLTHATLLYSSLPVMGTLESAARVGTRSVTFAFCDDKRDRHRSGTRWFTLAHGFRHFSPSLGRRHGGRSDSICGGGSVTWQTSPCNRAGNRTLEQDQHWV